MHAGSSQAVDAVEVRVPIREGADVEAVVAEAKAAFGRLGGSVSQMRVRAHASDSTRGRNDCWQLHVYTICNVLA